MIKYQTKIKKLIAELCPNGVEFKELGRLGDFYGGLSGKSNKDFINGNAKYVNYMNIFSNIAVNTDINTLVKVGVQEKQNKIKYGDVLFTGSSETPNECGMSSVLTKKLKIPLYLNSFCFGFRFHDVNLILPEFSKYLFRDEQIRKQIAKTASGVTRFNVSKKRFAKIIIPLPPIPIQEEIVKILNSFTELEGELEGELEARKKQYEHYHKKLLLEGTNSKNISLYEIGKVSMCKRIFKNETLTSGDIPFYKIGTFGKEPNAFISQKIYDEYRTKYSFPNKGDVLLSASGTIGRRVIYDGQPAYFQDSNIIWIDNDERKVLNKFLYYLYATVEWKTEGGTIQRLYNDNLKKIIIPIPPISEQEKIVKILDKFDALVNDISIGLPAELSARRSQYEYYREKLLTFKEYVRQ